MERQGQARGSFCMTLLRPKTFVWGLRRVICPEVACLPLKAESAEANFAFIPGHARGLLRRRIYI